MEETKPACNYMGSFSLLLRAPFVDRIGAVPYLVALALLAL